MSENLFGFDWLSRSVRLQEPRRLAYWADDLPVYAMLSPLETLHNARAAKQALESLRKIQSRLDPEEEQLYETAFEALDGKLHDVLWEGKITENHSYLRGLARNVKELVSKYWWHLEGTCIARKTEQWVGNRYHELTVEEGVRNRIHDEFDAWVEKWKPVERVLLSEKLCKRDKRVFLWSIRDGIKMPPVIGKAVSDFIQSVDRKLSEYISLLSQYYAEVLLRKVLRKFNPFQNLYVRLEVEEFEGYAAEL